MEAIEDAIRQSFNLRQYGSGEKPTLEIKWHAGKPASSKPIIREKYPTAYMVIDITSRVPNNGRIVVTDDGVGLMTKSYGTFYSSSALSGFDSITEFVDEVLEAAEDAGFFNRITLQ